MNAEHIVHETNLAFNLAVKVLPQIEFNPEWSKDKDALVHCPLFVRPVWFEDEQGRRVTVLPTEDCGNVVIHEQYMGAKAGRPLMGIFAMSFDQINESFGVSREAVADRYKRQKLVAGGVVTSAVFLDVFKQALGAQINGTTPLSLA